MDSKDVFKVYVLSRGIIAYLHNAFILSTIHNAQAAHPPPSKHRSVGWAKRKRGKDGSLDGSQDRDPQKRRLKMDVMSLSKADRDRLKQLVKVKKDEFRCIECIGLTETGSLVIRRDYDLLLIKYLDHELAVYHHYHYLQNNYHQVSDIHVKKGSIVT